MTWSAEKAAQDVCDELDHSDIGESVRRMFARHLQAAYDAGYADCDATDFASLEAFIKPAIDDALGIRKIPPEEAWLCSQVGGHRYGVNGRCIWCDAERGDGA